MAVIRWSEIWRIKIVGNVLPGQAFKLFICDVCGMGPCIMRERHSLYDWSNWVFFFFFFFSADKFFKRFNCWQLRSVEIIILTSSNPKWTKTMHPPPLNPKLSLDGYPFWAVLASNISLSAPLSFVNYTFLYDNR